MNLIILLRLVCAHLIGDFTLQTDKICEGKKSEGGKRIYYLMLHSFIHAVLAYLFVAQWKNWIIPVVVFTTHLLIDRFKNNKGKEKELKTFIIDQMAHLFIIFFLWAVFFTDLSHWIIIFENGRSGQFWVIASAYLLILQPSSLLLGMFIKKWTPNEIEDKSLPNAGKWIGYLERILILTFILTGKIEGVGFLLAAKSVFRFGELNKAQEIRTTEYVLIGTLASFTIAVLLGLGAKCLCD